MQRFNAAAILWKVLIANFPHYTADADSYTLNTLSEIISQVISKITVFLQYFSIILLRGILSSHE